MIQGLFSNAKKVILDGGIDFVNDTIKVGLLTSAYTLDTLDNVWGDVSANEIGASGGYVAGGVEVTGKTVTEDTVNEEGVFDGADTLITALVAADVQYFILYLDEATKTLIAYIDLEAPVAYTNQNVQITWHTDGILRTL